MVLGKAFEASSVFGEQDGWSRFCVTGVEVSPLPDSSDVVCKTRQDGRRGASTGTSLEKLSLRGPEAFITTFRRFADLLEVVVIVMMNGRLLLLVHEPPTFQSPGMSPCCQR